MAIEDAVVLAEQLARADEVEQAFRAFRDRRFQRCAYVARASLEICRGQIGLRPPVDPARATGEMLRVAAEAI